MEYDEIILGDDPFTNRIFEHPDFKKLEDTLRIAYFTKDYKPYEEYAQWAYLKYRQEKKLAIRELIESFKKGYIEHYSPIYISSKNSAIYISGPICGHIDNQGGIWLSDGHHRCALLRITNQPIKMRVISRADGWILLKESIFQIYGKKQTYQRFAHPDLADWSYIRGNERNDKIRPYIYGNVVNLGCAEGYMDYKLNKFSERWFAFENHHLRSNLAELQLARTKVRLVKEDFLEYDFPECDVLLLLSTFHHIWRQDREKAIGLLNKISQKTNRFIFEAANPSEPLWGEEVPKLPELVLKNTEFTKVIEIESPRKILVFEK